MSGLRFEDVSVRYGTARHGVTAVDRVSLHVPPGSVVGLVGESGSGKSTLARAAVGIVPLAGGRILFDDAPLPMTGRRPTQMVFQDPYSSLDPRMSIGESVKEALPPGMARTERDAEVTRLLGLVHMDATRAHAYPAHLSGGQRQRVALARALAGRPRVLIADEITSALDVSIQGAVLNLVRDLQRELGLSILFISHNLAVVRYVASHIAVMYLGRIVEFATAREVLTEPQHPYTRDLLAAIPRVRGATIGAHDRGAGGRRSASPATGLPVPHALPHRAARAAGPRDLRPCRAIQRPSSERRLPLRATPTRPGTGTEHPMNDSTPAAPDRPGRPIDAQHWQERLSSLAARYHVPGAQLGILRVTDSAPDELVVATHGVLSLRTETPTTADSLFQIGSITKVWTATVIMQLVDEGRIELDTPVVAVLPDLRLSDAEVTRSVTIRHLLTHTSGIDGDVFTDTGRGDECLERYVAGLADVAQNHPLGVTWSYCNSGYSLLGRVIEQLTGMTWDAALRERLFTPLGLSHTVTLPEEALLFGTAVGHVEDEGADGEQKVEGKQKVAPVWTLPRSIGPAGLITARAADVLAFARMHLTGGRAADGSSILGEASVAAMAAHQADLPDKYILGDSWGLGWIRFGWDGQRLIGHDGNTIGQAAFLRLLPAQGLAVTLLTNGGQTRDLFDELYREVFGELAGVAMPHPLVAPEVPVDVDPSPFVGSYVRASVRLDVLAPDAEHPLARLRTTVTGTLAELDPEPPKEYDMVAVGPDLFVVRSPESRMWVPLTFYTLDSGERYLHFGARATPRVS